MSLHIRILLSVFFINSAACSIATSTYVLPGYQTSGTSTVKKLTVLALLPEGHNQAGPALAQVAADRIALRKNYIIQNAQAFSLPLFNNCAPDSDAGILLVRVLAFEKQPAQVYLHLSAELFHCQNGILLWRSEANSKVDTDTPELSKLIAAYSQHFGPESISLIAPLFILLQPMLDTLPNPQLTDDEILEKITAEG